MTDEELRAARPGVFLGAELYAKLEAWIRKHYRERLAPADLRDPKLAEENRVALVELTRILGVGSIYPFQFAK